MILERAALVIHWAGGILAYSILAVLFYGIWKGTRRKVGRISGWMGTLLRSAWFYALGSIVFLGLCIIGWIPLPITPGVQWQAWLLGIGSVLLFPGMALVLWGRLALGREYFVSTSQGAQIFADQHLVKTGIYAVLRHPMYVGLILAAWGSLLVYATWTTLFFAICAPFIVLRAKQEDAVLAAEFGEQWQEYSRSVPGFFPKLRKEDREDE